MKHILGLPTKMLKIFMLYLNAFCAS